MSVVAGQQRADAGMGRLKAEMRQAARARVRKVDPNEQVMRQVERAKSRLRARLCSEYWVGVVAGDPAAVWGFHRTQCGTRYFPDAPCNCAHCRELRKFPSPHVGSVGVSYDCWCEANGKRQMEERDPRQPITEEEAEDAGLTIHVRRFREPKAITVLVAGCEGCEGLRSKGDRFCLSCAAKYRLKMIKAGYLPPTITEAL